MDTISKKGVNFDHPASFAFESIANYTRNFHWPILIFMYISVLKTRKCLAGSSNFVGTLFCIKWLLPNSKSWLPWNLSFLYILLHENRLQMMLWHHNTRVNSHQRWKQTRFRVCFHLWCELTSTMNVTEWQVSWNSWRFLEKVKLTVLWDYGVCLSVSKRG